MKPTPRLSPTQAEATCLLCGKCERVSAKDAILAAQEATRRIVAHRREKHYKTLPQTRETTGGDFSQPRALKRSSSGRADTAGRSSNRSQAVA